MSGCSGHESTSGLSLHEAKKQTQEMENRIAVLVPHEYVESSEQVTHGGLLSCGKNFYTWYGHTYLTLRGDPDFQRIYRSVVAGIKSDPRYELRMGRHHDGTPRAEISGPFGEQYFAAPNAKETQYEIMSYSPCFQLPEGIWLGGNY